MGGGPRLARPRHPIRTRVGGGFAERRARGDDVVAWGKKKGFAELMGGGDDAAVDTKKGKGAAAEAERCPCGGGEEGLPYSRCCKPFHKGEKYPQDCVALMKSRFSGYAKGEGEYVVKTTHPENPIFKDGAKAESGKVRDAGFIFCQRSGVVGRGLDGDTTADNRRQAGVGETLSLSSSYVTLPSPPFPDPLRFYVMAVFTTVIASPSHPPLCVVAPILPRTLLSAAARRLNFSRSGRVHVSRRRQDDVQEGSVLRPRDRVGEGGKEGRVHGRVQVQVQSARSEGVQRAGGGAPLGAQHVPARRGGGMALSRRHHGGGGVRGGAGQVPENPREPGRQAWQWP